MNTKKSSSVVLVPGYWLGSWAWDDMTKYLSRDDLSLTAVTLPGLESPSSRRDGIRLADHVDAVADAVQQSADPVVLVAHSGAGAIVTAVLDQVPHMVSRVVYVDSGPVTDGTIARPDIDPGTPELPLPTWAQLEADGASLAGLDEEILQRFHDRAVPHPTGPMREPVTLHDPRRNQVPATIVCCSMPSSLVRQMATNGGMFEALVDLTDIHYIDLPTGHWPMWSAPKELARIIEEAAYS